MRKHSRRMFDKRLIRLRIPWRYTLATNQNQLCAARFDDNGDSARCRLMASPLLLAVNYAVHASVTYSTTLNYVVLLLCFSDRALVHNVCVYHLNDMKSERAKGREREARAEGKYHDGHASCCSVLRLVCADSDSASSARFSPRANDNAPRREPLRSSSGSLVNRAQHNQRNNIAHAHATRYNDGATTTMFVCSESRVRHSTRQFD